MQFYSFYLDKTLTINQELSILSFYLLILFDPYAYKVMLFTFQVDLKILFFFVLKEVIYVSILMRLNYF